MLCFFNQASGKLPGIEYLAIEEDAFGGWEKCIYLKVNLINFLFKE